MRVGVSISRWPGAGGFIMHGGEANVWWTLATGAHWSHSALPCHWSITTDTHTAMGDPKMETFELYSLVVSSNLVNT